jgi:methylated-DNA-[protein]-cysteine S-methyltransferase
MRTCVVDTALGTMGIGWTERGLARLALPDGAGSVVARMARYGDPGEPPAELVPLMAGIVRYAEGTMVAFEVLQLDLDGEPAFRRQVYADIRRLGWGETTTYGAVARRLGDVQLSHAVGQAMGANPIPLVIPCHRVLAAAGRTGGFSAPGGVSTKMRMLALEHASTPEGQYAFGF